MTKYAVIKLNNRQFKVEEKKEFLLEGFNREKLNPEVLLVADGEKVKVGKPLVKGAKVVLKVVDKEIKGKKVRVLKYKSKSRYRKRIGFRPKHTLVRVEKITS